jgi:hypothetical protein
MSVGRRPLGGRRAGGTEKLPRICEEEVNDT